jgi:xanthine dehydrogenase small subunit
VAPVPLRCTRTEASLRGRHLDAGTIAEARRTLEAEISPIDDLRSTAHYRQRVAGNLLESFLRS